MSAIVASPQLAVLVTGLALVVTAVAMVAREIGARRRLVRGTLVVGLTATVALLTLVAARFYVLAS